MERAVCGKTCGCTAFAAVFCAPIVSSLFPQRHGGTSRIFSGFARTGCAWFTARPIRISSITSLRPAAQDRLLERFQIQYPYILYAGRIRPHKNIPRLIEAFAVVRGELEHHPSYQRLRLIIIGDEISRNPEVRRAVAQTRTEQVVRFLGFVPFRNFAGILRQRECICLSFSV